MGNPIIFERHGDIVTLGADNPPVNALGHAVRLALLGGLERAEAEGARAILIYGIGRTWFAGADIREFGKPAKEPILPDICNRFETSPLLMVSAIHGTALGGGLELALSTHYRIADKTARLGLPEVTLGIIPGAGGTQRLPRLTGAEIAVDIITTGRPVNAEKARQLGLVDEIADGDPKVFGLRFAEELLARHANPRPVRDAAAPEAIDFEAAKAKVLKRARGQLSPVVAVQAIEAACTMPFEQGLAEERRLFQEVMETDQRKGLIHAFFAERQVAKLPEIDGITVRNIESIGVIGGGTMGAGIATAALLSNMPVVLVEMSSEAAEKGRSRVIDNLEAGLKRGKIGQSAFDKATTELLTTGTDYAALSEADLIIEAVFEEMAIKKEVFAKLDAVAKPGAILATNTSYLDVNEIASATTRPGDVLGLHFFSPAHVMKLLEVVVAEATEPDVVATGFKLGKRLNKIPVRAGVCDGFIGNRILSTYRAAADHMVLDGASPYEIDQALEAFGFAMGPYAVADLAGLDIGWANRKRLAPTRDPRERVPTYVDRLCESGHFGSKTGQGYYVYEEGSKPRPNPEVPGLIEAERAAFGLEARSFSAEDIVRRYMAAMVNEAARVLEDGIARRPLDIDVVLLSGYGFPRYHGGPLKWADLQGLPKLLEDIRHYAAEDSYFWQEAPLLGKLVAEGRSFDDLNQEASA